MTNNLGGFYDVKNQVCRPSNFLDSLNLIDEHIELRKGLYDDKAVEMYTRQINGSGYIKGTRIYELQQYLKNFGFTEVGKLDGDFGAKTESAVKSFQTSALRKKRTVNNGNSIDVTITYTGKVDGIVNEKTWHEIQLWDSKKYKTQILLLGTHKYQFTTLALKKCIDTLPDELRSDFRQKIVETITKMHNLGFALGSPHKFRAGYRTFQEQHDINVKATSAGPGESFHNYGLAVDLGCLNWVDDKGNEYKEDFWLAKMDLHCKGMSSLFWNKRDELAPDGVNNIRPYEIIHLQGVPSDSHGYKAFEKCINSVSKWKYLQFGKTGKFRTYKCNLGKDIKQEKWTNIGTTKDMWDGKAKGCTQKQQESIKSDISLAETKALTIQLD